MWHGLRRRVWLGAATAALAGAPRRAVGQVAAGEEFPQRPVRVLVPFTPGGAPDVLARLLAEELGRQWPHPLVVESRPGAAGNIAAELVARAAPDGHTLLLMSNNIAAVNPHFGRTAFDPLADLAPVALLGRSPLVLVVNAELPSRSVAEFLDLARARPRGIAFASAGNGSPHHLAMALLASMAELELTHVPYRGTAPGLADLAAGRVQAMASPVGGALPLIADGRVRALAVAGARRLGALPGVPTVAEAGPLPGYETDTWLALAAPRGTPERTVRRIAAAAIAAMRTERAAALLPGRGVEIETAGPEELGALIHRDHARWGDLIRRAGLTGD